MILELQRATLGYFDRYVNASNGLVRDCSHHGASASIAGSGMAFACWVIAAERGYISRSDAAAKTLTALRFLWDAPQSDAADATGFNGFFYHFLDIGTGARVPRSELSTIDSGIAIIGALVAGQYFDRDTAGEIEIRRLADAIYLRANWHWATDNSGAIAHGWRPERGFIPYAWRGYSEAMLLYVLGLGSPTHRLDDRAWREWTSTYRWKRVYGQEYLYAGPLFTHLLSHAWVDFRGIQDAFMRGRGIDYFENSRRAVLVQREYAKRNPKKLAGYGENCWGITATAGPGSGFSEHAGRKRRVYGYRARGVPFGTDDGTLSPWVLAASLPFAPHDVERGLRHLAETYPALQGEHGYFSGFNPSIRGAAASGIRNGQQSVPATTDGREDCVWVSTCCYAIDQGPAAMMIENHLSGLIWKLLSGSPYVREGLERAGFSGGWLANPGELRPAAVA